MAERRARAAGATGAANRRRLRRRDLLRLAAVGAGGTALAGLLAACGGAPAAAPGGTVPAGPPTRAGAGETPAASGSVAFSVWGDPAEKAAYEQLAASFNRRQARVTAQLLHTPGQNDYLKRLATDFAGGTPADIILLNYRRFGAYAARGALAPVEPYLERSALLARDAFYPGVIAAFTRDGHLVGLPQNVSSLAIYYNRRLFDRAGLPHPGDGWTWDDFSGTARALTRGTEQYGVGIEPSLIRLAPFIWQNGGDIVDDLAAPTRLTLDRPESAEALQWFADLQLKHRVAPDAAQASAEDDESRFLGGRTAMFFDSRRAVPTLREITALDWDVAPLPGRKVRAGILHADAYFLTAAGRNKAAAWAFVEYANSTEGQTFIARTGRTVPSLRAVAESPVFLEPGGKPGNSRVFLDAIPVLRPALSIDTTEQVEGLVNNELKRAFYGQATVADAIATATDRTADLFRR